MEKVKLIIKQDTFMKNISNNITGVIFFKIGNHFFPENGWYDFPVVIMTWWLDGLNEIVNINNNKIELNFMDGPATIIVKNIDNSIYNIECVWNGIIEYKADVNMKSMCKELIDTSKLIVEVCKKNGWNDIEITKMIKLLIRFLDD